MNTDSRTTDSRLISTTATHRRRRHLAVYHKALRAAETPEQRAAVAARYRVLFTADVDRPAASQIASADLDRKCREVTVRVAA